jgi:hypothetical protein
MPTNTAARDRQKPQPFLRRMRLKLVAKRSVERNGCGVRAVDLQPDGRGAPLRGDSVQMRHKTTPQTEPAPLPVDRDAKARHLEAFLPSPQHSVGDDRPDSACRDHDVLVAAIR